MNSHQRRVARRRREREWISVSDIVNVTVGPLTPSEILADLEAGMSYLGRPLEGMGLVSRTAMLAQLPVEPQAATGAALDKLYKIPLRRDPVRDCCPTFATEPHDPYCRFCREDFH